MAPGASNQGKSNGIEGKNNFTSLDRAPKATDGVLLLGITIVAGLLRLRRIDSPRTPVYDESYMGVIVNEYRNGNHFFDLHPPFSRLLHYYVADFLGAPHCEYTKEMSWTECDMWQMRTVPLVLGTLLVPLTFLGARAHGSSVAGSLAGAALLASDSLFFAISRIHLLDVVTATMVAVVIAIHARLCGRLDGTASKEPRWLQEVAVLAAMDGAALGMAISSKFGVAVPTAVWCVLTLSLAAVHGWCHGQRLRTAATNLAATVAVLTWVALATYIFVLWVHFSLIPWKDPEEGSYTAFALSKKRITGVPFTAFDRGAEAIVLRFDYVGNIGGTTEKILEFTLEQVYYYLLLDRYELEVPRLPNSHHSHGPASGWLVAWRGLLHALFPQRLQGLTDSSGVLFLPNPLTCVLATIAVVATACGAMLRGVPVVANRFSTQRTASLGWGRGGGALVLGFVLHLAPFLSVHRELFIIYYSLSYYFAILALALVLGSDPFGRQPLLIAILLYLAFSVFVLIIPLVTGELEPADYLERMAQIMPACRAGACFNAPEGTPLRAALDRAGGDERLGVFPYLMGH